MNKRLIIHRILSWVVLLVFTISILPKSYFHEVVAGHTDSLVTCDFEEGKQECVHPEGFDCRFDDLVVTAHYLTASPSFSFEKPTTFPSHTSDFTSFVHQQNFLVAESRGPPSIVA